MSSLHKWIFMQRHTVADVDKRGENDDRVTPSWKIVLICSPTQTAFCICCMLFIVLHTLYYKLSSDLCRRSIRRPLCVHTLAASLCSQATWIYAPPPPRLPMLENALKMSAYISSLLCQATSISRCRRRPSRRCRSSLFIRPVSQSVRKKIIHSAAPSSNRTV